LVQVGNQWRAILRFAPTTIYQAPLPLRNFPTPPRVYREVFYDKLPDPDPTNRYDRPSADFHYIVNADPAETVIGLPTQGDYPRLIRVTYEVGGQVISRRLFYEGDTSDANPGVIDGLPPNVVVREVVEEYPIDPASFVFANGVLTFNNPMPGPSSGITPNQLGFLRVDYFVADPQLGDHWVVETGTTFDPDPTLKQQGVSSVFQTTFGGMTNFQTVYLMPNKDDDGDRHFDEDLPDGSDNDGDGKVDEDPRWGDVLAPIRSDLQSGLFAFILPVGTRLRVAYRAGDDPNTPVDESWFLQVIKPPDDFQLFTQADQQVLSTFPFEQLRWFTAQLIPDDPRTPLVVDPYFRLQFSALLAGLNVQVRYQVRYFNPNPRQTHDETYSEVKGIDSNGAVTIPIPLPPQGWTVDLNNTKIEEVRGASLLVRVSGGSMWRQSPPKTRADYVELATIVPPPAKLTQP
jgi:hypothetical protein